MEKRGLVLSKKLKGCTVIEGFPGFGLVGTIATGFLIDHLKCEKIAKYYFEEGPATIALHECEIVDPIGIYYNKKYNLVIVHSITSPLGLEWKVSDLILDLCKQVQAKELITIEGVSGPPNSKNINAYYFSDDKKLIAKWKKIKQTCLPEGIIVGVTSALMMKSTVPLSCVFAETSSNLPDSKASAKVIELLDAYLGLKVDYKPLLKQQEDFEKKLKTLLDQAMKTQESVKKGRIPNYFG